MKKAILVLPVIVLQASCSGSDPIKDAQSICDCFTKANSIPEEDPKRTLEQDKCSEMQLQKTSKYQTDEEIKNFGEALAECSEKIMRQALEEQ